MISLSTALFLLQTIAPDTVLTFWRLACAAALIVGLALGYWLQRPTDPFAKTHHEPAHAAGHAEDQAEPADADTDRRGPRHSGIGVTAWRPMHRAGAVQHRGRHHTGDRRWSGNLIQHTQAGDITIDQLAEAMAGVR